MDIFFLLSLYVYLILFLFITTATLIFFNKSWGRLPHLYLKLLEMVQSEFQEVYPDDYFEQLPFKDIITDKKSILELNDPRPNDFELVEMHTEFPFSTNINLIRSGLEAIIQDEFTGSLEFAPDYQKYRLNGPLWQYLAGKLRLKILFIVLVVIRFAIIFPVRVLLYTSAFGFLAVCCFMTWFMKFDMSQKLSITRRFCRLYTSGFGCIAFFYGKENRPKIPGIAVSNHLSANDIMVIAQDVHKKQEFVYTVTGQEHGGIIGAIQRLVSKLCSTLWLERSIADSRLKFLKEVLRVAKDNHLVLMFPEGYCSNGSRVLQFRKAVFEKGIDVYPIAIRQDARFGDAFWKEDWFGKYLLRILSNLATIYHVHYLPAVQRQDHELPEEFASRVQSLIAKVANSRSLHFQGNLYYKKTDRDKYKSHLQKMCANELFLIAEARNEKEYQVSASDGP